MTTLPSFRLDDPAAILKNFDVAVEEARQLFSKASDSVLAENWELKMGGQTLRSLFELRSAERWRLQ